MQGFRLYCSGCIGAVRGCSAAVLSDSSQGTKHSNREDLSRQKTLRAWYLLCETPLLGYLEPLYLHLYQRLAEPKRLYELITWTRWGKSLGTRMSIQGL